MEGGQAAFPASGVEMMAHLYISLDNAYCAVCERSDEKENSGHYPLHSAHYFIRRFLKHQQLLLLLLLLLSNVNDTCQKQASWQEARSEKRLLP
jgi:hypothetical protein